MHGQVSLYKITRHQFRARSSSFLLLLALASGCATVRPTLDITPSGDLGAHDTRDVVDAVYARGRYKPNV
jgi:hypothetical protein